MQPAADNQPDQGMTADPPEIPQPRTAADQEPSPYARPAAAAYPSYAQPYPGAAQAQPQALPPAAPVAPQAPIVPTQPAGPPPGTGTPPVVALPEVEPEYAGHHRHLQLTYEPQSAYPAYPAYPPTVPHQPGWTPGQPWPPVMPPPPPPRKRWTAAIAAVLVGVLVLCVLPALGAVGFVLLSGRGEPSAHSSVGPDGTRAPARRPVAGDRWDVYRDWMIDRVREALAARDEALVSGDKAGYLGSGDPAQPKAISLMTKQYAALQAMRVEAWRSEVKGLPVKESGEEFDAVWRFDIAAHACFGARICQESTSVRTEYWRLVGERARVQEIKISSTKGEGPRPWEVADLTAQVGTRTIVVASTKHAAELPRITKLAEKAAEVADRFAYREKPSKYVIYYAFPSEWKSWFSWNPPDWTGGVSISVGANRSEVLLNAAAISRSGQDNMLRHEFTHASSVPGTTGDRAPWWLVEGIAEYAEMDGSPVRIYSALPYTTKLIKSGTWNGKVDVSAPRDADKDADVAGKYGIAFLAVRQLAERYSEAKMVQFFNAVVHERSTLDKASQEAFGSPWSTVESELAAYIRGVAR